MRLRVIDFGAALEPATLPAEVAAAVDALGLDLPGMEADDLAAAIVSAVHRG